MAVNINKLQRDIIDWANAAIPDRTPKDILLKLHEETTDLVKNPTSIHEASDLVILLLDFIGFYGVDGERLLEAAGEKMEINKSRKWAVDRRTTIVSHV